MRLNYYEIEKATTALLQAIGEDLEREGLKGTPERVADSYMALLHGYNCSEEEIKILLTTFDSEAYDQMVMLKQIEFYSLCEHHLLPFFGQATIAYIPNERVAGISKLARILDIYSRRLQMQERLTDQITNALMKYLKPKGAACHIQAVHFCMRARGVSKQNSIMVTNSLKGIFLEDAQAREEFLELAK